MGLVVRVQTTLEFFVLRATRDEFHYVGVTDVS